VSLRENSVFPQVILSKSKVKVIIASSVDCAQLTKAKRLVGHLLLRWIAAGGCAFGEGCCESVGERGGMFFYIFPPFTFFSASFALLRQTFHLSPD